MKIIKKVVLDKKEIALFKASLLLRGETFRSWSAKCYDKDTETCGQVSNIVAGKPISKKVFDRFLKPLNLPFFKDFKWEEEHETIRSDVNWEEE